MMATFLRILGLSLTLIFSFGAVVGAMITMYAAVANRTTEIGTLRPWGFSVPISCWPFCWSHCFWIPGRRAGPAVRVGIAIDQRLYH